MSPVGLGLLAFACALGGALGGTWLRTVLPEHHLDDDSRETVKLGIGLVATITALVLGLVTASAKSSFDEVHTAVKQTSADVLTLDRLLTRYGPETGEIRRGLQVAIVGRIEMIWPTNSSATGDFDPVQSGAASRAEALADAIRHLTPRDDSQRSLQSRALDLAEEVLEARWAMFTVGTSVPLPFVAILLFWLTITFTSFGLFAPRNGTVFAVLFLCAVSVGSAVFLILELDGPFDGLLKVSAEPLRYAHAHLNQ